MQLVSIIMPIYNAEKYLSEAIESILNQTYKNIELICINDGSTDNSLKILEEYAIRDSRIKVYSQENHGEAYTRNRGLELITGKYTTFIDSDDTCSIDSIETALNTAIKNDSNIVINFLNIHNNCNKEIKDHSFICSVQMFLKSSFIKENKDIKFNTKLNMGPDAIFSHKILALTDKISKNYDAIYYYRQHECQISKNIEAQSERLLSNIRIWFSELKEFYTEKNLWKIKNDHIMNFLLEQPFYHYLHGKWNKRQKKEIFLLIHNFVKTNNLQDNFTRKDIRIFMYRKFLRAKKWQDFEIYLKIMHLLIIIKSKLREL